jgi:hypothetical protein
VPSRPIPCPKCKNPIPVTDDDVVTPGARKARKRSAAELRETVVANLRETRPGSADPQAAVEDPPTRDVPTAEQDIPADPPTRDVPTAEHDLPTTDPPTRDVPTTESPALTSDEPAREKVAATVPAPDDPPTRDMPAAELPDTAERAPLQNRAPGSGKSPKSLPKGKLSLGSLRPPKGEKGDAPAAKDSDDRESRSGAPRLKMKKLDLSGLKKAINKKETTDEPVDSAPGTQDSEPVVEPGGIGEALETSSSVLSQPPDSEELSEAELDEAPAESVDETITSADISIEEIPMDDIPIDDIGLEEDEADASGAEVDPVEDSPIEDAPAEAPVEETPVEETPDEDPGGVDLELGADVDSSDTDWDQTFSEEAPYELTDSSNPPVAGIVIAGGIVLALLAAAYFLLV